MIDGPGAAAISVSGAIVGYLWWWVIYGEGGRGLPGIREFGRAPSWVRALLGERRSTVTATGELVVPGRQRRGSYSRLRGHEWGGGGQRLGSR